MIGTETVQGMVLELQDEMSQYQHQFGVRRNHFLVEAMSYGMSEEEARSYAIQSIGPVVPVAYMPTLAPGKTRPLSPMLAARYRYAGIGRTSTSICSCQMKCCGSQVQSSSAAGSAICGITGWNRLHTDSGMIVFRCCRLRARKRVTFPCSSGRSLVKSLKYGRMLCSMNTDSVICSIGSSG